MSRLKRNAALAAVVVVAVGGFEGLRREAYRDPVGIPTICFGETRDVRMGMVKTREECDALLYQSLIVHEHDMGRCLDDPESIPDLTWGAFVSFTYNVGAAAFCNSTLARKANAGDLKGACNQLPRWTRGTIAGRKVRLPGLVKRREAERQMCLDGLREPG